MQIQSPHIPLAVYRELAAHLQQIEGVTVEFLEVAKDRPFNYTESQLGGLAINGVDRLVEQDLARLQLILSYYADRYSRATS
jgi:hypothetical protein